MRREYNSLQSWRTPAFQSSRKMKDSECKETIWEHREQTHTIRSLTKELFGRVRSLPYFTIVRDLQKQRNKSPVVSFPECGRERVPLESPSYHRVAMLVFQRPESHDRERDLRVRSFGQMQGHCSSPQHFQRRHSQGGRLRARWEREALRPHEEGCGSAELPQGPLRLRAPPCKNLEKFQNNSEQRVLLLNMMDESASGANLTSANHGIFLSPLLAPTQEICQVIRRLRRYGQTNAAYIWRFLTGDTTGVHIYEARAGKYLSYNILQDSYRFSWSVVVLYCRLVLYHTTNER